MPNAQCPMPNTQYPRLKTQDYKMVGINLASWKLTSSKQKRLALMALLEDIESKSQFLEPVT